MEYGDRGGFRSNNFGAPREMHKATCADCGKECDVPFKPSAGRPVYCRDCYQKHKKFQVVFERIETVTLTIFFVGFLYDDSKKLE